MATDKKKYDINVSSEALDEYITNGYNSPYKSQIDAALGEINQNQKFKYDAGADPTYAFYKKQYTDAGRRAMTDTQAQSAALTGGYGNSYGQTAGQSVYNEYMSKLGDIVPTLEQNAYSRHQNDQNARYQRLSTLLGLDDTEYNRWNAGYSMLADKYARDYGAAQDARNFNYQIDRDDVADARYEEERDYSRTHPTVTSSGSSSASGKNGGSASAGLSDSELKALASAASNYSSNSDIWNAANYIIDSFGEESAALFLMYVGISDPYTFMNTGGKKGGLNFGSAKPEGENQRARIKRVRGLR